MILDKNESELFELLIFCGVESYLSEVNELCQKNNDFESLILVLKELEVLLSKLGFDMDISIKEIRKNEK